MLFRFLRHTPVDFDEGNRTWYSEGDTVVGRILKRDDKGVWLQVHSDDDMTVIVDHDSFVILDRFECWTEELPQTCNLCNKVLQSCFFTHSSLVVCHHCFLLNEETQFQKYEHDKSEDKWVKIVPPKFEEIS